MSTVYVLAAIGVAVYYIQEARTFWAGVTGVFKAIVWPAVIAFKVFHTFKL